MSRQKHIPVLFTCFLFTSFCPAQNKTIREQEALFYRQNEAQRKRIDSLQQVLLTTATNTESVNCLNKLSEEYTRFTSAKAWQCAIKAYDLATKINFIGGTAEALQNLGRIAQVSGRLEEAEKYYRQVPALYKKINATKEWTLANRTLGYNLLLQ